MKSQAELVFRELKTRLGEYTCWPRIEEQLILYCTEIPSNRSGKIAKFKQIIIYLKEQDCDKETLDFLTDEIQMYEETEQIAVYTEKNDEVDKNIISAFAKLECKEGVVKTQKDFNYSQINKIVNGIYEKTGKIVFIISKEMSIRGKIVAEAHDQKMKIPIASIIQAKKKLITPDGDKYLKKALLFGEVYEKNAYTKIKEVEIPFRIYRFLTEDNEEMFVMSAEEEEIPIGDCTITGMIKQIDDYQQISDSYKVLTKMPIFFLHNYVTRMIVYKDSAELRTMLRGVNKEAWYEYPFTVKNTQGQRVISKQPEWFKQLTWAWMLHSKNGFNQEYPFHIMMVGEAGGGKSTLLNSIYEKTKEARPIFSGSSSTLKSLVPSFKEKPAKIGYLAEANRFAFLDEFLRCTQRARSEDGSEDIMAVMNDLLEHQKRRAGSGVSSVNVNMTARAFATTNPVKRMKNLQDLLNKYDKSFLSRWLIYWQSREHINLIQDANEAKLPLFNEQIEDYDFISMIDFLQLQKVEFDMDALMEIYKTPLRFLSSDLRDHYTARHKHHIVCLLDGIVKTRYIRSTEHTELKATKKDYLVLKIVWGKLISSWINTDQIREMPLEDRKYYLSEDSQIMLDVISKEGKKHDKKVLRENLFPDYTQNEFIEGYMFLREAGLVMEDEQEIWATETNLGEVSEWLI